MKNKQTYTGAGIIWFVLGLALVVSGNAGGWVFFILGLAFWARATQQGDSWASENPRLARGLIVALVVLAVLIVIVTLVQGLGRV